MQSGCGCVWVKCVVPAGYLMPHDRVKQTQPSLQSWPLRVSPTGLPLTAWQLGRRLAEATPTNRAWVAPGHGWSGPSYLNRHLIRSRPSKGGGEERGEAARVPPMLYPLAGLYRTAKM